MQILLVLSGLIFGVALSTRHSAYILIPTSIATAAIASTMSFAAGDGSLGIVLTTVLAVTALQIGYVVGVIFSGTATHRNIADARDAPIESTYGRVDVVYFKRTLAKTQ